jgi:HD-GYP domain-containing protein (c-di-GMP phosphodiesterase class II)
MTATGFDASANQSRRDRREELGRAAFLALYAILRNARVHAAENDVFDAPLAQFAKSLKELVETDGGFDLQFASDGVYVNRQAIRLDATTTALVGFVRRELLRIGVHGVSARAAPDTDELRNLVARLAGNATVPLFALTLTQAASGADASHIRSHDTRLVDAYSYALFFVSKTIAQLRAGAQGLPVWAASRLVQDFVDLEQAAPRRFLQLARCKAGGEAYYPYHSANVAVLAISFGGRLGLSRSRRHDLGMAALFHDIGVAAIPAAKLHSADELTERELASMQIMPLFAARAILRDREVHPAALERARAAYDCHCDVAGPRAEPERPPGALGRVLALCEAFDALTTTRPYRGAYEPGEAVHVLRTELAHRFDAGLVEKFTEAIGALLI